MLHDVLQVSREDLLINSCVYVRQVLDSVPNGSLEGLHLRRVTLTKSYDALDWHGTKVPGQDDTQRQLRDRTGSSGVMLVNAHRLACVKLRPREELGHAFH